MNGVAKTGKSKNAISTMKLRYAQCWEDCDLLLEHLAVKPGEVCLSICSAGDNSLSLLTKSPAKVVAIDQCRAQLACTALKVEAFRNLEYQTLLGFLGATPMSADQRRKIYLGLCQGLKPGFRQYLDAHQRQIEEGIITTGKLEKYFALFRTCVLPLLHSRKTIAELFTKKSKEERESFYYVRWNTVNYQLLLRGFFSKAMFYCFGREKSFFRYLDGGMSEFIANAAKACILAEDSYKNPYLSFILRGHYGTRLPHYLRPESYALIRENLDKLELVEANLKDYLVNGAYSFDCLNLSDVFEYLSERQSQEMAGLLVQHSNSGARQVYWNMLVERKLSQYVPSLNCSYELKADLAGIAQSFFYSGFFVETKICTEC